MVVNYITIPMKGVGLTSYSQSNSKFLEMNIENIMKEGFKATYMNEGGEFADDMANNFAKAIAKPLSKAIDDYVQNMIKSQNILITPAALISPVGPVTGAMTTMTDITIM